MHRRPPRSPPFPYPPLFRSLRFPPARQDSSALKPMGQAVVGALEDARVERLLCLQHPGVRRWFEACIAPEPDPSDLGFAAFMARLDRMLLWPERMDGNHWIHKARDLFENTATRSEEHTSELQSPCNLVCRLLLEKKK